MALRDVGTPNDVPAEGVMAFMGKLNELNAVVTKLGGDPTRPMFGVGYLDDPTQPH